MEPENIAKVEKEGAASPVFSGLNFVIFVLVFLGLVVFASFSLSRFFKRSTPSNYSSGGAVSGSPQGADIPSYECVNDAYENSTQLEVAEKKILLTEGDTRAIKNGLLLRDGLLQFVGEDEEVVISDFAPGVDISAIVTSKSLNDIETNYKVYLRNHRNRDSEVIFDETYNNSKQYDYTYRVRDVAFSEDGTLLAITTSNEVYIYDRNTDSLSLEYSTTPPPPGSMGIFSYFDPRFSPDNSMFLLSTGYYEGMSTDIYDLQQDVLKELEFFQYMSGVSVESWYDDRLIVQKYGYSPEEDGLYFVDPDFPEEMSRIVGFNYEGSAGDVVYRYRNVAVASDSIYYTTDFEMASGKFACNNVGERYEVRADFTTLFKYDFLTGESAEILTVERTRSSGLQIPYFVLSKFSVVEVSGEEMLVLTIIEETTPHHYLLDSSNNLIELEL